MRAWTLKELGVEFSQAFRGHGNTIQKVYCKVDILKLRFEIKIWKFENRKIPIWKLGMAYIWICDVGITRRSQVNLKIKLCKCKISTFKFGSLENVYPLTLKVFKITILQVQISAWKFGNLDKIYPPDCVVVKLKLLKLQLCNFATSNSQFANL